MKNRELNYQQAIEIAENIYWVGFLDENVGLHCNPYLIVDGDEAVLIDSGSRGDFSTVMLKVMRTGTSPNKIRRLIYQHYDPDLCGNVLHMEEVINSQDLKIISHRENIIFINHYAARSPKLCIEDIGMHYEFSSGRRLDFILTPFAHAPGNFITYDRKTRVLFSSDIFGSYDFSWSLYTEIGGRCSGCNAVETCPYTNKRCQLAGIRDFHKRVMPSARALNYALDRIEELDVSLIAPQHGSILDTRESREVAIRHLRSLDCVGFDCFLKGNDV